MSTFLRDCGLLHRFAPFFIVMAKRFIGTELFNDPWFMDLSVEGKVFFIYIITSCDHAGIIKFNWKLAEFQIGIKDLANSYETLIKEFGDKLVKLKNEYYWMPKFLEYQYPQFPNSNVKAQSSAIRILLSFGISSYNNLTLTQPLTKGYGNGNEYGYGKGNKKGGSGGKTQKDLIIMKLREKGINDTDINEILMKHSHDYFLIGQKYLSKN